jgi:MFS family permease
MRDTSIWLALRNPTFRALWLATLVSGTCIAAHNMAAFSVLGETENSAFLISQMATLSALPFAVFTLPAGTLADIVDRKKILCAVNLWQALIAACLMTLGLTHVLNPWAILASAFLFNLGFAFGSPASSSVVTEMVSKEELASANTLGSLHINIGGVIGPLIGAFLIPIVGASVVFGINGLGFLFLFLAILRWKQPRKQTDLPLEDFFTTLTTAINYLRYGPGIKVIVMRSVVFSFFISIIPTLIPVVGVKRLHLDPAHLGYLFTSMAIGSVVGAVFITSWARARFSPNKLTICANLLLVSVGFLMALVDHPHVFMLVAALGGAGWTLTASELWIAGQRAMPDWARGRMNATIIMASQAATALGGLVWGAAAEEVGVVATFLALGFFAVLAMLFVHVIWKDLSIDFATDLDFEPAQFAILSYNVDPGRLTRAKANVLCVSTEFVVDPARRDQFIGLMREARLICLRNGAHRWHLYEDVIQPGKFIMEVESSSGNEYLRLRERMTKAEKDLMDQISNLHADSNPREFARILIDQEVLERRSS